MGLPPVVLDSGSGSIKCGCAGISPLPLFVCPTVAGRPSATATTLHTLLRSSGETVLSSRGVLASSTSPIEDAAHVHRTQLLLQQATLCGDELDGLRGSCELTYPVRNGVIQDMSAMQQLWDYVLCRRLPSLLAATAPAAIMSASATGEGSDGWLEGCQLLLTEPPNLSLKQRCDVLELFFETYHVTAIQSTPQGVLSLFANGTESGVVVECGEGLTHCTPVFDGCVLTTAQRRLDLGGQAVTSYLAQLLQESQHSVRGGGDGALRGRRRTSGIEVAEVDIVRRLKERYCYVSVAHDVDRRLAQSTTALHRRCTLPDGAVCHLNAERFTAPEVLFTPSLLHLECPGIADVLWNCTEAADVDVRRALYSNIILSGGGTMLAGFGARLATDMRRRYLQEKLKGDEGRMSRCPITVREPPRRQYMAYMGGALMAELTAGQDEMWLSRRDYEESGAAAVVARYQSLS